MKPGSKPDRTLTTLFTSTSLFLTAVRAYERSLKDTEPPHDNALISIVFAAATVEAAINELHTASSAFLKATGYKNATIRTFVDLQDELEDARGSIKSKMIMAKWVLSGKPLDKGSSLYQDFAALTDLRNELVHMKGLAGDSPFDEWPQFREPKAITHLRSKKLLSIPKSKDEVSWTDLIRNSACALWACRTAANVALELASNLPSDHDFWAVVRHIFNDSFRNDLVLKLAGADKARKY